MTQPTTCLILGATGFIGGQIARAALARGWQVSGVRRSPDAVGDLAGLPIRWLQADLNDPASLRIALRDWRSSVVRRPSSVLFHCAGAYPAQRQDHGPRRGGRPPADAQRAGHRGRGRRGAAGLHELLHDHRRAGRASGRLADERDFYIPGSADDPYYEAKWAMEVEALAAARAGLPVVVLCPVAVFGPGDVHMAVSQPLLMAAKGRMPFYLDASFSVVDVRDVAEAHLAAAERGRIGERYILSAHNLTLQEGLTEIAAVAGAAPPRLKIGGRLLDAVIAAGGLVPGSNVGYLRTMRLWRPVSNAKAVAELGLSTRPFAETVADALAWFRARGQL